ncbi:hypothetical protein BJV78DRAFT_1158549 [Lactifluus subvellereus]|nr:hypothetical protein BJV78DRAFT_1158549 [Lactifluus subvellereus]
MLAVLVAKTVVDALEPKGIYDLVIKLSQLPYLNVKHQYLWGGLTVSDATPNGYLICRWIMMWKLSMWCMYMNKTPLTISINSPLELVQQFFIKLGAQYVIVTDADGYYEGLIDKNGWLAFLDELEMKAT